ncbi:hypothetical protein [Micromonospora sediminicola]|uniref:hypothetical protein n=1 Tax=Micromonospora sediminicola TaxID=946078 RepID=UPI0037B2193B
MNPQTRPLDADAIQDHLAANWHQDQCACDDWPTACIYRHLTPATWTVEAVVNAIEVMTDQSTVERQPEYHVGRDWTGHVVEDACPCSKAACGLVIQSAADPTCEHHPTAQCIPMRQIHRADQCCGVPEAVTA